MQNFMKVPFKMPEIFPHTLGGGLEIWASTFEFMFEKYVLFFTRIPYQYKRDCKVMKNFKWWVYFKYKWKINTKDTVQQSIWVWRNIQTSLFLQHKSPIKIQKQHKCLLKYGLKLNTKYTVLWNICTKHIIAQYLNGPLNTLGTLFQSS